MAKEVEEDRVFLFMYMYVAETSLFLWPTDDEILWLWCHPLGPLSLQRAEERRSFFPNEEEEERVASQWREEEMYLEESEGGGLNGFLFFYSAVSRTPFASADCH